MGTPIRSCEGQPKSVEGFGTFSDVPFVLKKCHYINLDTPELEIWIPNHDINTSKFTLLTKKHQAEHVSGSEIRLGGKPCTTRASLLKRNEKGKKKLLSL